MKDYLEVTLEILGLAVRFLTIAIIAFACLFTLVGVVCFLFSLLEKVLNSFI